MLGSNLTSLRGLLSDEELDTIERNAGLERALALMAASGPSTSPTSFASVLQQGLQQGRQAEQAGLQSALQTRQLKQAAQKEQRRKQVLGMLRPDASAALAGGGGPTMENAAKMGGTDKTRFVQAINSAIELGDLELAKQLKEQMDTLFPAFKTQSVQDLRVGDEIIKFAVGEDASKRELGVAPEDLIEVNAGGQKLLVGKTTGKKMAQFGVTMTPSEAGNLAVAQGNLAMRQREFNKPSYDFMNVDGTVVVGDKSTGQVSNQGAIPKSQQQVLGAANAVLEAKDIIPKSTGGAIGTGVDMALGAFGVGTEGAKNIAKLDVIGAKLVSNVPRFEGPQSNIDVQMYRQAAADVSNPLKPASVRMAALRTAAELIAKDAQIKGVQLPSDFSQFVAGVDPAPATVPTGRANADVNSLIDKYAPKGN